MPFCPKCGAEIPEEAEFCPYCGTRLREGKARRVHEEKHEKREKEEKTEKGEKHEKEADKTGPITGGLILIYLGITFYLAFNDIISWEKWWAYFLLGLGGILIIRAAMISVMTKRVRVAYGSLIGGVVLCLIGATGVLGIKHWWPLILVALGIAIIISALRERKKSPRP